MVASPQNHPEFVPAGPASLHSKTATNTPRRDGDTAAPARPRRLLQLIETGGPGGAENVLRNLSRCARAHDIPVEVGLLREGWLADALREEGIEPWILPEPGRLDVGWAWRTAREVRRRGIDVIHAHEFAMNCAGSLVARLAGARCITTVHGNNYYPDKWRRRMAYRAVAFGAQMVAVSCHTREHLAVTLGVDRERIAVVPNGLDTAAHAPAPQARARLRAELGLAADTTLIGATGNLYTVKGHAYLVEALAQLRQRGHKVAVAIAGRGPEEAPLRALAQQHGVADALHLLGFREDVPALLQAFDLYAMPSLSEGMPLALIEAMAAGKPIVASAAGGIPEIASAHDTALLVPPADATALAAALGRLLEEPALADSLARKGRERARERFSLNAMFEAYMDLYRHDD